MKILASNRLSVPKLERTNALFPLKLVSTENTIKTSKAAMRSSMTLLAMIQLMISIFILETMMIQQCSLEGCNFELK